MTTNLPQRFAAKFSPEPNSGCWIWTAALTGHGYGNFSLGAGGAMRMVSAHRFAYEALVGPVPTGLVLDHVCRTRCCVNPAHLRPVTVAENTAAGLARDTLIARNRSRGAAKRCRRGHSMANAIKRPNGRRACRSCAAARNDAYRGRLREALAITPETLGGGAS